MLLTEVTLRYFKAAFRPGPISLGPFNVIIGRNGSGKSTLLEALQWLDETIRRDAREACNRYFGSTDLINLRAQSDDRYFELTLRWSTPESDKQWKYTTRVVDDDGAPKISAESLDLLRKSGRLDKSFVITKSQERRVLPDGQENGAGAFPVREPDRLAMPRAAESSRAASSDSPTFLTAFWERAVFLRLSPNRLAHGSAAKKKSFEPILDEEGQMLPALLSELSNSQRQILVSYVSDILPNIIGVDVPKPLMGSAARVHYNLLEKMPYKGRAGRKQFPIPAWMLSEGTRRITAILALLVREPSPSLICIEEVENGLDPWAVKVLLGHLQSAADRGTQIILTTHSPWLLDDVPMESIIQVRRIEGDTKYERFIDRPEIKAFDPSVPAGTRYVNEP